ncbi:MAG: hypothetical protein WCP85_27815 [Mariniphaga sp.]
MKAIDRLFQYFEYKQIKPTRFEKDFGLSNGYLGIQLRRKADIGTSILKTIIDNCHDLDITWLITGKGHMLNGVADSNLPLRVTENELIRMTSHMNCSNCKIKEVFLESIQNRLRV